MLHLHTFVLGLCPQISPLKDTLKDWNPNPKVVRLHFSLIFVMTQLQIMSHSEDQWSLSGRSRAYWEVTKLALR